MLGGALPRGCNGDMSGIGKRRPNMMSVRVGKTTYNRTRVIAANRGASIRSVVEDAIETYRRHHFLMQLSADFAALRANRSEWQKELNERKIWEQTLGDDIEAE